MASNKQETLNAIINDIFKLNDPKIDDSRKSEISDLVKISVNGDEPLDHLAINAALSEDKPGALVYILTNFRIIKIEIDKEIKSTSFHLTSIVSVERQLLDNNTSRFSVRFQNGSSLGLKYPTAEQRITNFFQKLDQQPQPKEPRRG